MNLQYTDKKLLDLCDEYGNKALFWRKKFIGLLPEVNKRQLYKKAGCSSIFEFAKKKAGLSEKQVRLTLNLSERFENTPVLKKLLTDGAVSINKLARVVSVATVENQEFWAQQAKVLPNRSLETLVRDEKIIASGPVTNVETAPIQPRIPVEDLHVQTSTSHLKITPEVEARLLKLQNAGHNISNLLTKLLDQREQEIGERKLQQAKKYEERAQAMDEGIAKNEQFQAVKMPTAPSSPSRYIPASIRKILKDEFGTKCAIPHCKNCSKTIHHILRFAQSQNHNPYYMAPLCKEHHDIAHSIDNKFLERKNL